jgi:hypothetical protein
MQLSENTLTILKNFATINTGLFFRKGNVLRTVSPGKTVLAEATIDEDIPSDFGIHELNQLLSIISLHKETPELNVTGNNLVIKGRDGRSKITYRCCDESMIRVPPEDKKITLPSEDLSFVLTESDLNWIMKSSAVLGVPHISVVGRNGKLYIGTLDMSNDAAHTDSLEIADYSGEPVEFIFKVENWKMIPGSYQVTISSAPPSKGVSLFQNQAKKLRYWMALESKSN